MTSAPLVDFDSMDLVGRTVMVRADLNVPLDKNSTAPAESPQRITDDGRIRASLPTLRSLLDRGARVVVCSHLGRPKGSYDAALSLAPVAARLQELLASPVHFAGNGTTDVAGEHAQQLVNQAKPGEVVLLDNLRFDSRETSKDEQERSDLAHLLADLVGAGRHGDQPQGIYVGDGFGAVHRKHASVYELPHLLPHTAGLLVSAEVQVLRRLTDEVKRPYAVILGGSKVSDKLGVIDNVLNLLQAGDKLVIGGGMVFTVLAAQGATVGKSLLEADQVETVKQYVHRAQERGIQVVLPTDIVAASEFAADADALVVSAQEIPDDRMGLDIGPDSAQAFAQALSDCATIFWNGPMGVFEMPRFAKGTQVVAQAVADAAGFTVIGGGDSAAAVRALGFADSDFGHISTGGGASLEYLEGKQLPGLQALGLVDEVKE